MRTELIRARRLYIPARLHPTLGLQLVDTNVIADIKHVRYNGGWISANQYF